VLELSQSCCWTSKPLNWFSSSSTSSSISWLMRELMSSSRVVTICLHFAGRILMIFITWSIVVYLCLTLSILQPESWTLKTFHFLNVFILLHQASYFWIKVGAFVSFTNTFPSWVILKESKIVLAESLLVRWF
jgi:hypothetical protein